MKKLYKYNIHKEHYVDIIEYYHIWCIYTYTFIYTYTHTYCMILPYIKRDLELQHFSMGLWMQTETGSMTHSGFLRDGKGTQGSTAFLPFVLLPPFIKFYHPICHMSLMNEHVQMHVQGYKWGGVGGVCNSSVFVVWIPKLRTAYMWVRQFFYVFPSKSHFKLEIIYAVTFSVKIACTVISNYLKYFSFRIHFTFIDSSICAYLDRKLMIKYPSYVFSLFITKAL